MMLGDPARLLELADIARKAGTAGQLNVLEWGSGESTAVLLAEICRRESGRLLTIDHDSSYQAQVLAGLMGRPGLIPFVADLAGNLDPSSAEPNYATLPMTLPWGWDLIVIDGRRRLECALVASAISSPITVVALHDYRRERYALVKTILDVVKDLPEYRLMRRRS